MNLTTTRDERFSTIRAEGRLTATSVPVLRAAIAGLVEDGDTRVVIDLSATEFIDSSGLGVLIGGLKTARQAGGDLRIAGATDAVRKVLSLTNLDRVLRNHSSAAEAFDGE